MAKLHCSIINKTFLIFVLSLFPFEFEVECSPFLNLGSLTKLIQDNPQKKSDAKSVETKSLPLKDLGNVFSSTGKLIVLLILSTPGHLMHQYYHN